MTALSGEIEAFISRSYQYPNETVNDRAGYWEIESFQFTRGDDGDLGGPYYIAITGYTAASYSIKVKVYRSDANASA